MTACSSSFYPESLSHFYLFVCLIVWLAYRASEVSPSHMYVSHRDFGINYIRECGSTLYVGLTGMFRTLIQKSTGMVLR